MFYFLEEVKIQLRFIINLISQCWLTYLKVLLQLVRKKLKLTQSILYFNPGILGMRTKLYKKRFKNIQDAFLFLVIYNAVIGGKSGSLGKRSVVSPIDIKILDSYSKNFKILVCASLYHTLRQILTRQKT